MSSQATSEAVASAREAFDRHSWQEAYDLLKHADEAGALSAAEIEMLAMAAWWCSGIEDCIAARERAFAAHLEEGNPRRAALVALSLARDHRQRLALTVANAWFARAERLLGAEEPESVEHGYLEVHRASYRANEGKNEEAYEAAARALEIGSRFGDPDLQGLSLMAQGMAEIGRGNVQAGFDLLDEATVAAVGSELSPYVTGIIYCNTIDACSRVGDYRRAGEWTDAARRWCERQSITGFPGVCRIHRAEIMRLRGWWAEAERDARQAGTELIDHGVPAMAAGGFTEVGLIRMRMGDFNAAEDAFRQAHELGSDGMPGLALLRLAQGQVKVAMDLVRRSLDELKDALGRTHLLPAAVEVAVAAGDLEAADEWATELEKAAEEFGTEAIRAASLCSTASVQIARGDGSSALKNAREGWKLWQSLETPYEAAIARISIGLAYRTSGDEDAAARELDSARAALQKLGSVTDLKRLDELAEPGPSVAETRVLRTFVFTDIERSTNLVEAIGDEAWENLVGWHDRTLRALFESHSGEEVSHAGDGFFVAFENPKQALECAVAIQRSLAEHRRTAGFAPQVRVGIHASEATQRPGDYGGRGVHEAARIGALAGGGEIVASLETVESAGGGWQTSDQREVALKGIATPAKVVTVSWQQE